MNDCTVGAKGTNSSKGELDEVLLLPPEFL